MTELTDEQIIAADEIGPERAPLEGASENAGVPSGAVGPARQALDAARVDLLQRIDDGIAPRQFVPGGEEWLLAGKRYLLVAKAGSGKTLVAIVVAVDVVAAGGTVAIVDVENGEDEYARRLDDVLRARGDDALAGACRERLRYYAYPRLSAKWSEEDWASAFDGVGLVVFDSSRLVLSAAGLAEDSNDDYSVFVSSLLVPLTRAGTTTLVLDNTGHDERDRPRGASAKSDLNEAVYTVKVAERFGRETTGRVRLTRHRDRFDLPRTLTVPLGGDSYGPVQVDEAAAAGEDSGEDFRPTGLMEKASKVIEATPGLNRGEVLEATGGKKEYATLALSRLVEEGYVRQEIDGRAKLHHSVRPFREAEEDLSGPGSLSGPDQVRDLVPGDPSPYGEGPVDRGGGTDDEGPDEVPATEDEEMEAERLAAKFGDITSSSTKTPEVEAAS